MKDRGYKEEFCCKDPEGYGGTAGYDPNTGAPYGRKHDGFCGFLAKEIWTALNGAEKGDYDMVGPQVRRIIERLEEILGVGLEAAAAAYKEGKPAEIHFWVRCRQGRHGGARPRGGASL